MVVRVFFFFPLYGILTKKLKSKEKIKKPRKHKLEVLSKPYLVYYVWQKKRGGYYADVVCIIL